MLKIEQLSHQYSSQWAIKDINISISNKGIYGLLGANGAGKSTILNILSGSLRQSEGRVYIAGIDMNIDPVSTKSKIGYLPQNPPLYMDLTVYEYLEYSALLRHIPKANVNNAVEEVMQLCSITHFRNRLLKNLSGGYQQRVGIAQAIVHKPELVILDEPTNGLDPNQILYIRDLIREIAKERCVIISTHILREVEALCNHIFMIHNGSLVFTGSIEQYLSYIKPSSMSVIFMAQPTKEEIEAIPGVSLVDELGSNRYRIFFEQGEDISSKIIKYSYERSWLLRELQFEGSSLDAVFATLSKHK